METRFKLGDRVKILHHKDKKRIGQEGIVTKVIPVFKSKEEANEAIENGFLGKFTIKTEKTVQTTGFYKIAVNNSNSLPGYACDSDIQFQN